MNTITLKKVWEDNYYKRGEFYEINVCVSSDNIIANTNTYMSEIQMNDLLNKLDKFINLKIKSFCWETSKKGKEYTNDVILNFNTDKKGHISCKVFLQIDSNLEYSCNFEVSGFEYISLERLYNQLKKMNDANINYAASTGEI